MAVLLPAVLGAPLGCAAAVFGVGLLTDKVLIDYEQRRGRTRALRAFGLALVGFGVVFAGGPAIIALRSSAGGPITAAQTLAAALVILLWFAGRPRDARTPWDPGRGNAGHRSAGHRSAAGGPSGRRLGDGRPR